MVMRITLSHVEELGRVLLILKVLMNLFENRRGFSKPRRGEGRREPIFDLNEEL
ncbi:MAG: hypothetical protein ABSB80_11740 [Methanoregula sp.]|jgi:hypothetical protein|uniref:hypothetical protein n=1 Tax=Methanoregula sp. TaxID=2052170 RepID=UPI003D0F9BA8